MFNTPEFQALQREYLQSAIERCAHLKHEAELLRAGQPVDLKNLRQEIHKFRGSGGFYGFKELSLASGEAEDHLILVMDGELERDDRAIADRVERVIATAEAATRKLGAGS